MKPIKIAPSILSADFSCLKKEVMAIKSAGADMIHIDVMDGHFVPNITIGPVVVKDLRKITDLPLDVHLMIENPQKYIDSFVQAGSDMITLHIETISKKELGSWSAELRRRNVKVGLSLNPGTPLKKIEGVLDLADFVLVMTVNPGFGGQEFIPAVLPKIKKLRKIFKGDISVDGGINAERAKEVAACGADILVSGSYIFKSKNYHDAIRSLKCAR